MEVSPVRLKTADVAGTLEWAASVLELTDTAAMRAMAGNTAHRGIRDIPTPPNPHCRPLYALIATTAALRPREGGVSEAHAPEGAVDSLDDWRIQPFHDFDDGKTAFYNKTQEGGF